jgi:hypothetical protein
VLLVKTFWLIAAAVCGVVALFFAFKGDYEKAFVAAAVGGVAWILNYRTQLRQKLNDDEYEGTDTND